MCTLLHSEIVQISNYITMEEGDTKTCPNCKREIPSVNFTIHSVHCARNIRVCPVCKEPVPAADLNTHHNQLHKLVPCKQCGEDVCGSDLEDHLRDSCALTPGACRHCELELPRRELPPHESYCGARTQRCSCGELVMIKYQELHEQSNHGFIKLEDEPGPEPSWSKNERTKGLKHSAGSTRAIPFFTNRQAGASNSNSEFDRDANGASVWTVTADSNVSNFRTSENSNPPIGEHNLNARKAPVKRTNDKPQINTTAPNASKVDKAITSGAGPRGGVKKRPAPPPPPAAGAALRDPAYWSAAARRQHEERERQQQSDYNASVGLPPVLSPAAKLEKLRKMDALANREFDAPADGGGRLRARAAAAPPPAGEPLGRARARSDAIDANDSSEHREAEANGRSRLQPMSAAEFVSRFEWLQVSGAGAEGGGGGGGAGDGAAGERAGGDDRFGDIKRELRKLRRGLNEVTAPYNSVNSANPPGAARALPPLSRSPASPPPSPVLPPAPPLQLPPPLAYDYLQGYHEVARDADGNDVALPCEFCGQLVPADELVLHETGCRPDLAQFNVQSRRAPGSPRIMRGNANEARGGVNVARGGVNVARGVVNASRVDINTARDGVNAARENANAVRDEDIDEPVIPCEFCMHPYPIHLLMEHQEFCVG